MTSPCSRHGGNAPQLALPAGSAVVGPPQERTQSQLQDCRMQPASGKPPGLAQALAQLLSWRGCPSACPCCWQLERPAAAHHQSQRRCRSPAMLPVAEPPQRRPSLELHRKLLHCPAASSHSRQCGGEATAAGQGGVEAGPLRLPTSVAATASASQQPRSCLLELLQRPLVLLEPLVLLHIAPPPPVLPPEAQPPPPEQPLLLVVARQHQQSPL